MVRLHKDSVGGVERVDPLPYLPPPVPLPTTHFRSITSVQATTRPITPPCTVRGAQICGWQGEV